MRTLNTHLNDEQLDSSINFLERNYGLIADGLEDLDCTIALCDGGLVAVGNGNLEHEIRTQPRYAAIKNRPILLLNFAEYLSTKGGEDGIAGALKQYSLRMAAQSPVPRAHSAYALPKEPDRSMRGSMFD